ncbi:glycoside hydrolase family 26 protein [Peptococcus simiae]|uniref:glycoside hydrolase family 26 protein n=1 Tax=Peptococcus simiae TaxID=1643805 RepID=UPI0039806982
MQKSTEKTSTQLGRAAICIVIIGSTLLGLASFEPKKVHPAAASTQDLLFKTSYQLTDSGQGQVLTNRVDGYRVILPKGAQVAFDRAQLRTEISWTKDSRLDIYLTPTLPTDSDPAYYLQLCSGQDPSAPHAFRNSKDHQVTFQEEVQFAGLAGVATAWDRTPLTRVENDRPHYYAIDMISDKGQGISFMYRAAQPISQSQRDQVNAIADSLKLQPPSASPYMAPDPANRRHPLDLNQQTAAVYTKYFSKAAPLRWGIFDPDYANQRYGYLHGLEKDFDTHFPFLVHYIDVINSDPESKIAPILNQAQAEGRAVELTFQTANPPEGPNQVYEILNGKYDHYLEDLAVVIRESRATILLRVGNEMNGDWCAYSPVHLSRDPDIYKAFYRYVCDFFSKEGVAGQMLFVWNPNEADFPPYKWNDPGLTWPGNEYVEIIGLTAYNNGTYYPHEKWRSFNAMYLPLYQEYQALYDQPMMITEFSSSSFGGDKAAWVRDMLATIDTGYPNIKVAIWWNHEDFDPNKTGVVSRAYRIDDNPDVLHAFRDYFANHNPA